MNLEKPAQITLQTAKESGGGGKCRSFNNPVQITLQKMEGGGEESTYLPMCASYPPAAHSFRLSTWGSFYVSVVASALQSPVGHVRNLQSFSSLGLWKVELCGQEDPCLLIGLPGPDLAHGQYFEDLWYN